MNQISFESECAGADHEWKALVRPLIDRMRQHLQGAHREGVGSWSTPPLPKGYLVYVSGDGIRIVVHKNTGRASDSNPDAAGWFYPAYAPFTKVRVDVLLHEDTGT